MKKLEQYVNASRQENLKLMKKLPKEDYDVLVGACDIGLIFLDHRFTIPNFPSRLLGYMQAKIPVLAVTDSNTDIGKTIVEGGFGWWCESNNSDHFKEMICRLLQEKTCECSGLEYDYLLKNYSVEQAYKIIKSRVEK